MPKDPLGMQFLDAPSAPGAPRPMSFIDAPPPLPPRPADVVARTEQLAKEHKFGSADLKKLGEFRSQQAVDAFLRNRPNRPGMILDRIVRSGGIEPQERAKLTAIANRQLGMEAESLQNAYNASLASGGGRQVGSRLLPYGGRLLSAQQQAQSNLDRIAMERKQRALEMQLQLKEQRQQRKYEANQQRQKILGDILKTGLKVGLNFIPGIGTAASAGLTAADAARGAISQGMPRGPQSFIPPSYMQYTPDPRDSQFGTSGFPQMLPSKAMSPVDQIGYGVDSMSLENPYFGRDVA